MADISVIKKETEEKMKMTIEFLDESLYSAGRANTHISTACVWNIWKFGSLQTATITTPTKPINTTVENDAGIEKPYQSNVGITLKTTRSDPINILLDRRTTKTMVKQTKQEPKTQK